MKILFAASEAVPFIKSGGLADVAGSLSKALRNHRQACRVVIPLYEDIPECHREGMRFITNFYVPLGWRNQYCGVFEKTVGGVKFYFINNEYYFRRHGLYGFFDDAERFAFFSKAVLEMIQYIDYEPEIIHCNDWQTALIPVYMNVFYRHLERYRDIRTVFTIHNIQYQGTYDYKIRFDVLGLPESASGIVEFAKDCNLMKGGLEECDAITTVSPTYADEILDPWYSHGLHGILAGNRYKTRGILNGIDNTLYNPETDNALTANYSAEKPDKKKICKKHLQTSLGLEENPDAMMLAMITRLVGHKGIDLVQNVLKNMMNMNIQFVLLGSGDWQYEKFFREAVMRYPGRISVNLAFDEPLSHRIYAGADAFLMPSRSEPCGLSQMIALSYGTIPIVRKTGGLNDSVRDFGGENGNGYNFLNCDPYDMLNAVTRCYEDFQDKNCWREHVISAMECDFGWSKSAKEYIALYRELIGESPA